MTRQEKLLKLIEERLNKDEVINYYVEGAFESTVKGRQNTMTGVLVTTNEKIRFCGKRFFLVYDDIIEYKDIEYVEANEEKLGHKIFIISKDIHNFVDSINKNL